MSKPKWYNWTGNTMWDEYCRIMLLFLLFIASLFLLVYGAAFYNTFVRHIS